MSMTSTWMGGWERVIIFDDIREEGVIIDFWTIEPSHGRWARLEIRKCTDATAVSRDTC